MKRNIYCFLLSAVMAVGLLGGCGSDTQEDVLENSSQEADGTDDETDTQGGEGEITAISMYVMGLGTVTDYEMVEEAVNEISREKIGVEVNLNILDVSQWSEQSNLLLSGSEPVDLMLNIGSLASGVAQGAWLELDNLYAEYRQDIMKYYDEDYLKAGYVNGHLYGIAPQKDYAQFKIILYRADIVEELGIDVSGVENLEDWMPVMAAEKKRIRI